MMMKPVKKKVSTSVEVDGFLQGVVVLLRIGAAGGLANVFWRQRRQCRLLMKARSGAVLDGNGRGGAQIEAKLWSQSGRTVAEGRRS